MPRACPRANEQPRSVLNTGQVGQAGYCTWQAGQYGTVHRESGVHFDPEVSLAFRPFPFWTNLTFVARGTKLKPRLKCPEAFKLVAWAR